MRNARLAILILGSIVLVACGADQIAPGRTELIGEASAVLTTATPTDQPVTPTMFNSQIISPSPTVPEITATIAPTAGPTATPTALLCWHMGGNFEIGELESEFLPDPLSYRIYLPPCYAEQPERHYPVLYLIHGQSSNDDQWERLGVGGVLDELVANGELTPMIVVMPRDRLWKEPTEDNFGKVVAEELTPWIDDNYHTVPDRKFRAVGGLSRGGAWALHLGFEYWELFGSIGAHSGFIFHTDTYLVNGWLDEIQFESMPRIYMDAGDSDRPSILRSALWFENLLTQRGIAHEWHIFSGYHEEAYWQDHVEDYLRWYAKEWGMEEP